MTELRTVRVAAIQATPVVLDAGASVDGDGFLTAYRWDFGDGETSDVLRDRRTVHAYSAPGTYVARLTITDNSGVGNDTATDAVTVIVNDPPVAAVGPDIAAGQRVQLLIPGNTFHTARLLGPGEWFLGGSTEWPAVVPTEDVEIGDAEKLAAQYPDVAEDIRAIIASIA